jgi:hypothetical protein
MNCALQALFSIRWFDRQCIEQKLLLKDHPDLFTDIARKYRTIENLKTLNEFYKSKFLRTDQNRAEDAFEFLMRICDDLHVSSPTFSENNDCTCYKQTLSIISGNSLHKKRYMCCGHIEQRLYIFNILYVTSDIINIEDALLFQSHLLTNVKCDTCQKITDVDCDVSIHRLPVILVFQFCDAYGDRPLNECIEFRHRHGDYQNKYTYVLRSIVLYTGNHYSTLIVKDEATFILANDDHLSSLTYFEKEFIVGLVYENICVQSLQNFM